MAKTPQRTNKKEAMSKKSYREEIPDYLNTIVFFEGMMTEQLRRADALATATADSPLRRRLRAQGVLA